MKQAIRTTILAFFVLLAGCHAPAGNPPAASMALKLYDVPPSRTGPLAEALGNAMGKSASVTVPAPGKLLVYAPDSSQRSVATVLATLDKSAPQADAPARLNVHFWVIDGEAGAGEDDTALQALAASLSALRKTLGPMHFRLDQAAALAGSAGEFGNLTTNATRYTRQFRFRATAVEGDAVQLEVGYQDAGSDGLGSLATRIGTRFGQYVVLAQAPGACPSPSNSSAMPACADKPATRLLVVRVDRANPPA